jgi:hypothetical protein
MALHVALGCTGLSARIRDQAATTSSEPNVEVKRRAQRVRLNLVLGSPAALRRPN